MPILSCADDGIDVDVDPGGAGTEGGASRYRTVGKDHLGRREEPEATLRNGLDGRHDDDSVFR